MDKKLNLRPLGLYIFSIDHIKNHLMNVKISACNNIHMNWSVHYYKIPACPGKEKCCECGSSPTKILYIVYVKMREKVKISSYNNIIIYA